MNWYTNNTSTAYTQYEKFSWTKQMLYFYKKDRNHISWPTIFFKFAMMILDSSLLREEDLTFKLLFQSWNFYLKDEKQWFWAKRKSSYKSFSLPRLPGLFTRITCIKIWITVQTTSPCRPASFLLSLIIRFSFCGIPAAGWSIWSFLLIIPTITTVSVSSGCRSRLGRLCWKRRPGSISKYF